MKGWLTRQVNAAWYQGHGWLRPLRPLSALVAWQAGWRRARFQARRERPPVPVLVVGNLTVGGTGKTPMVLALCEAARALDLRVVVISRGYGARAPSWPWRVTSEQTARVAGDEPLMLARRSGMPVILDPRRRRALDAACALAPDLVIADDGLQHFDLPRTCELVMLDGRRGLGNGLCLPAGPLREPARHLHQVDWVVANGRGAPMPAGAVPMTLEPELPRPLNGGVATLPPGPVHAVAGIGDPDRFFALLRQMGYVPIEHPFPDHHAYRAEDLDFDDRLPVLMTEKDAVKCSEFLTPSLFYLPVRARLPDGFAESVLRATLSAHHDPTTPRRMP